MFLVWDAKDGKLKLRLRKPDEVYIPWYESAFGKEQDRSLLPPQFMQVRRSAGGDLGKAEEPKSTSLLFLRRLPIWTLTFSGI